MTSNIIYHDFRQKAEPVAAPASTVFLTAAVLAKGRRVLKAMESVNAALNTACVFLCGACAAASVLIFLILSGAL